MARPDDASNAIGAAMRLATRSGLARASRFGHELADDQGEVGDRRDHGGRCPACRRWPMRHPASAQEAGQVAAERGAAHRAGEDADQGDPDLHRREEPGRVVEHAAAPPRRRDRPGAARCSSRPRRDDIIASSDMASTPLSSIRPNTIATSTRILMVRTDPSVAAVGVMSRADRRGAAAGGQHGSRDGTASSQAATTQRLASRSAGSTKWSMSSAWSSSAAMPPTMPSAISTAGAVGDAAAVPGRAPRPAEASAQQRRPDQQQGQTTTTSTGASGLAKASAKAAMAVSNGASGPVGRTRTQRSVDHGRRMASPAHRPAPPRTTRSTARGHRRPAPGCRPAARGPVAEPGRVGDPHPAVARADPGSQHGLAADIGPGRAGSSSSLTSGRASTPPPPEPERPRWQRPRPRKQHLQLPAELGASQSRTAGQPPRPAPARGTRSPA